MQGGGPALEGRPRDPMLMTRPLSFAPHTWASSSYANCLWEPPSPFVPSTCLLSV